MKKFLFIILVYTLTISNTFIASAEHGDEVQIVSEAAILVDSQSGAVLFDKNGHHQMYPASLTKIATASTPLRMGI
ncbi:hypothetical protein ACFYKX_02515 [Cytobacillus sp. FJAT-54145]|uniref:Peptidase S11 D-alanyl-D-alanine carboxypeptidase A N-terminal domain-containing protein n=1 Tax=Cytobacillus spartinae TaxID=3299023 RepID=A0ABW6K5M9_9BACI